MIDQLIKRYEGLGIVKGDEWYLPLKETKRLVEECSQKKMAVIGIDFVHIRQGTVHPQVPINSADWSAFLHAACWQDVVAQCNTASLRVLAQEERADPEQFCSLVFFSAEEWTADVQPQPDQPE